MVQLRTHRTALALYGVLLVLPTLALGYLQWHQIVQEKDEELARAPRDAESAVARFRSALQTRLESMLQAENARPTDHYANWYCPDTTPEGDWALLPSPLREAPRPAGVMAWFVFDLLERPDASPEMFFGPQPLLDEPQMEGLRHSASSLYERLRADGELSARARSRLDYSDYDLPLRALAANRAGPDDEECLRAIRMYLSEVHVTMITSPFHVQFYLEADGTPRLVATRGVMAASMPEMVGLNECLHRLRRGLALVQGFYIDPEWFFGTVPDQVARSVLSQRERFLRAGESCCDDGREVVAVIRPIADLEIETRDPLLSNWGEMRVVVDTADIDQRFNRRAVRFAGVAVMLALSLATGLALLWRSIESDLDRAQRTENFVAAVTHELRTPLASIQMHGEMLLDGWAKDVDKQREYYARIVRETQRLSTLVERVLEKAKLTSGSAEPLAGDLSRAVAGLEETLTRFGDGDLSFELAGDLPAVMLTSEAVRSILVNLVENARKYAPVDRTKPDAEPIRVVTRREGERVVLEVLDRGPGVPEKERERIFEAFHRVGDEGTRTTRGTGLGLHLVALHAQSLGGRAQMLPRPGGGSIFRVTFALAPGEIA